MSRFGATILDAEGLRLSADEKSFFTEVDPFGFILFGRNLETPEQIHALCSEMREAVGREAPILIDQEGGRVQRLRGPRWREWLPPLEHVEAAGEAAEEAMYLRYRLIAHELRAVGVDGNCAPLVDVAREATHEFLKNRCYGFDAETVARLGRAVADGMLDGGVLPVVKHIPGHGLALVDSHHELPVADVPHEELSAVDFAPFRALSDLPMGMTAHVVYSALDALPATTSNVVMKCIREEIGFGGLIMSDDISMKALDGSLTDIARDALSAGCDVILHCNGTLDERRAVAEAAGQLSNKGQARAESALEARREPDEVDIPAMEAKLEALMNGRVYGG
ncbi:beta-hexosaminidase [Roseovarius sp. HI0049]|nr:beta-hexosaminidase [Roseovarius sp. HI0049]